LALWSIQHACLDDEEQEEVLGLWQIQWDSFLDWVVEQYGECLKASKDQR
jgi:adenosine deaminase CECR1